MVIAYHEGTVTGTVMDKQKEKEEAEAKKKHEEEAKKHAEEAKHTEEAAAKKKQEEETAAAQKTTTGTTQGPGGGSGTGTTPGGGAGGSGGGGPKPSPNATIVGTSVNVNPAGAFALKIKCPAGETSCTGTITLRTLKAVIANAASEAKRKPKATVLTLATGSFTVTGGQTKTVTLRLTATGRKLLTHSHTLSARVTINAHDPTGATKTSQAVVMLRAQKAKRG